MDLELIEQSKFEYQLISNLENSLKFCFLNHRESNKFSPIVFDEFVNDSIEKNVDNSMVSDGIYFLSSYKDKADYYIDTHTGLIYIKIGDRFRVAVNTCFSKEYDVFDAAYLRKYLNNANFRNQIAFAPVGPITSLNYLGTNIEDIFSEPILEYEVSTLQELEDLISEIEKILCKSRFFNKLWFRGQRKEYLSTRTASTIKKLGFPDSYQKMPSLIPSLGRNIENGSFDKIQLANTYWDKAFRVWVLSQMQGYGSAFSRGTKSYNQLISGLEAPKMMEFINHCSYDIEDVLIIKREEELTMVLAMQQYGAQTSVLDITDDLDVALFFSQSCFNNKTKKFELCEPNSENVIYVMAQCRGTGTVDLSVDLYKHLSFSFDEAIPLPARIKRQKCGIQTGANMYAKNTYAYRVIAKIKLNGSNILTKKTVSEMFPNATEDSLYQTFLDAKPTLDGLYG